MNEEKRELVKRLAKEAGFADTRAAVYEDGMLFFFFTPYRPAPKPEYGKINLSNYYVASQSGYHAAKKVIARLAEEGIGAKLFQKHGVKRLVLETGGFSGMNTLYYHEQYGSFCAVHAVQTDFVCEADRSKEKKECPQCGNCIAACPTNAVRVSGFLRERCIRNDMCERSIPPKSGQFIYQLLGCERCQLACPYNKGEMGEEYSYDLTGVIEGKYTKEIAGLVGTNYGKRRIIVGQAVIYAANTFYTPALPAIEALLGDEFLDETAQWAVMQLKKS